MKRRIHLHGYLKDLCPHPIELDADTVAEAINGLCRVTRGAFNPNPKTGRHLIKVVGFDIAEHLFMKSDVEDLHIVPAFVGGKSSGIMQIVIGVVLIAAAFVTAGGSLAGFVAAGGGLTVAGSIAMAGAMMVLGGIMAMMSAAPTLNAGTFGAGINPAASKYLGANKNTVKIGTRIPILVGRYPVFGHILSFNVDAQNVAA
jgi:predicted phage tail protein